MRFEDAQRALQQFLAPLTVDEFLDQTLAGGFCKIEGGETSPRIGRPVMSCVYWSKSAPRLTDSSDPAGVSARGRVDHIGNAVIVVIGIAGVTKRISVGVLL